MEKSRETDNRDRDAKPGTPASAKIRRYFGLIYALIDHKNKRVELTYSPRYKDPLSDGHRQRCLSWALTALSEYQDRGYVFTVPVRADSAPIV